MSTTLRLPTELTEFNLREPPRSLLIRGEPGSGKTTLAMTMLAAFRGQRIFVSSRVLRPELERDFQWVAPDAPDIQIVEALVSEPERVRDRRRALERAGELVDARSAAGEVEKLWLPDALTDAYSRISVGRPGMVVVDSWDALVERYLGVPPSEAARLPDRSEIERLLIGLMGRGHVHLVLVVEREAPSQLDYLVDGVVYCTTQHDGTRLERWLHLKKMRGVRVEHPSYPFTLDGGRFQCIAPLPGHLRPVLPRPDLEPDPQPGFLWPGSTQFASNFGRLPLGGVTLIETDPDIPAESVVLFCAPIFSEVARRGGRALHILPPRGNPEDVYLAYRPVVSPQEFMSMVRIFSATGSAPRGPHQAILEKVLLPGVSATAEGVEPRMPEAVRFLNEGLDAGIPSVSFVFVSGLAHAGVGMAHPYTPENLPAIILRTVESGQVHAVLVGNSADPLLAGLREMARVKIEMHAKHGRVFVYGRSPITPPLVLAAGEEAQPYQLIRIV